MTDEQIDYIEKVKLPEWEQYGIGYACKTIRELIAEIRTIKRGKPEAKKK